MYASEVLLDVLDALNISTEDLPKMPEVHIPNLKEIFEGRNAIIVVSAGVLGFVAYFLATKSNKKSDKKANKKGR